MVDDAVYCVVESHHLRVLEAHGVQRPEERHRCVQIERLLGSCAVFQVSVGRIYMRKESGGERAHSVPTSSMSPSLHLEESVGLIRNVFADDGKTLQGTGTKTTCLAC